jgi:riboflavin kinase
MPKPVLWFTLYSLAEMGAYGRGINISTTSLAEKLELSQQSASRHLIELEHLGLIERQITARGELVRITQKGVEELRRVYLGLKTILEAPTPSFLAFEGEVFSGLGEGAYYISLRGYRRQIVKKLGFDPYPGTLNLKLTSKIDFQTRKELDIRPGIILEGFENETRSYGPAKCFKALINNAVEGAVITALRTHYDESVLEVIAPVYLRTRLNLKDGDKVQLKVFVLSPQEDSV